MKKLVSFILVMAALCCIAAPALADSQNNLPLPSAYPAQTINGDPSTVGLYERSIRPSYQLR